MSVNIEFEGGFRLTSDSMNWIIERKKFVDPTKAPNWPKRKAEGASPEITEKWGDPTFHPRISQAVDKILDTKLRESNATTLRDLHLKMAEFRREISDKLEGRES